MFPRATAGFLGMLFGFRNLSFKTHPGSSGFGLPRFEIVKPQVDDLQFVEWLRLGHHCLGQRVGARSYFPKMGCYFAQYWTWICFGGAFWGCAFFHLKEPQWIANLLLNFLGSTLDWLIKTIRSGH